MEIVKPSVEHMGRILEEWANSEISWRYEANFKLVRQVFEQYKSNKDKGEVCAKVSILDYCYSTNLKEGYLSAVKNIIESDFDNKVGDKGFDVRKKLLNEMVTVKSKRFKTKDVLSFATKYCFQYNHLFPIYDDNVRAMLVLINNKYRFCSNKISKNSLRKNYDLFVKTCAEFCGSPLFFDKPINYKQMDDYLWRWSKLINI